MIPIYLTLLSVVIYSIGSIIRKKVSEVDDSLNYIYTVLFQFTGGISVLFVSLTLGMSGEYSNYLALLTPEILLRMLLGSALWLASTLASFKALNLISVSKFSIIETLNPVLSIILALVFLGETLLSYQFLGMFLILASVFVVVYDKETKFSRFSKGEMFAFLCSALAAVALINDKGIYLVMPLTPTLAIMFIVPGLLGVLARPKELKKLPIVIKNKQIVLQLLTMGFLWSISAIAYYKAVVLSNSLSLVVAISQLSVILTVLIGLIFLKETKNWQIKIAASIVSCVGLVLMSV